MSGIFEFLKSKPRKRFLSLLVEAGSDSLGAALVAHDIGVKQPIIIYTAREPFVFKYDLNISRYARSMLAALKRILKKIESEGRSHLKFTSLSTVKPEKIFCVFESPWYMSKTKEVRFLDDPPKLITKEFVDDFIKNSVLKPNVEEKDFSGHKCVEFTTQKFLLNGYHTNFPYGKKAKIFEAVVYEGSMDKNILQAIIDILDSQFHFEYDLEAHTFPLAGISAMRHIAPTFHNYILVNIGGEMSEVTVIKNRIILETASFPLGIHALLRSLAQALKTTPDEARSLAALDLKGAAEGAVSEKLNKSMVKTKEEWRTLFIETLEGFMAYGTLPDTLFLLSEEDMSERFSAWASEKLPSQFIGTNNINVVALDRKAIEKHIAYGEGASPDTRLSFLTIFLDRLLTPVSSGDPVLYANVRAPLPIDFLCSQTLSTGK